MKNFLHVGCGAKRKEHTTPAFVSADWEELRLDIDPSVAPEIVASMLDMAAVASANVSAVFSSHNLEHLYAHDVPVALCEFRRRGLPRSPGGLRRSGGGAAGRPLYQSPSSPVTALDVIYGYGPLLAKGDFHMAHRAGFTDKSLRNALHAAGFSSVATLRLAAPIYELWALATVSGKDEALARRLAREHFPGVRRVDPA